LVTGEAAAVTEAARWSDLEVPAPISDVAASVATDQLAAIIYTSGTTGHPKGVMLSHANLAANIRSIQQYLPIAADDRMLCVLPFYYSYGNSVLHSHLAKGATLILENSLMYPHKVVARMAELKATAFAGVPSTFYLLLARTKLAEFDLSSLRYCTQAGGGMDKTKIAQWCETVPQAQFFVMYGQTEASARLTYLPPGQRVEKAGSVGIAIPGVELSVRDENDNALDVGISGEVCARGDNVMLGYWRDEQESASVLRNGWLHTGDVGYRDADGFFFLVGRNKEMIKTGAHRVSPREIEELIASVDGVEEVAVIGVADEVMGQVIKACVVARGADQDALYRDTPYYEELRKKILRLCREQLAIYKMPKAVEFYEGFPKTASGKIQKHLIDPAA
jgi:acyl-CoA synthetase (AMP-forming)/AMP-acid ligase II